MRNAIFAACALILGAAVHPPSAVAQTRIMPLGDSITQGGFDYASYRYWLYFGLVNEGHSIDFVGQNTDIFPSDPPNLTWYPDYQTTFDRDHEGYWGFRTDEVATLVGAATTAAQPDIVLLHLGTNDIGQLGPSGLSNADTNLRQIITTIRGIVPDVTFLMARVIPIGPGNGYSSNAHLVEPLNDIIGDIVSTMYTTQSPIIGIDHNTAFDPDSMFQSDGLHPNTTGEIFMATQWFNVLDAILSGTPPLFVDITNPANGAVFVTPGNVSVAADVFDPNTFVDRVSFFANDAPIDVDTTEPYEAMWTGAAPGNYMLRVDGVDTGGATRVSSSIAITVLPDGSGTPVPIVNPSFEDPILADSTFVEGPGVLSGWDFFATDSTSVGILNPSSGSYPGADTTATPPGADSTNVAFLTNYGGAADSVSVSQVLADTLALDASYVLSVAVGKFLPDQPLPFASFGGYAISLLAGSEVLGTTEDILDPDFGEFQEAVLLVDGQAVNPAAVGDTLSILIELGVKGADRSTHFDDVRLVRYDAPIIIDVGEGVIAPPTRWTLAPNPARRGTRVAFTLDRSAMVRVDLFDVAGRHVRAILPGERRAAGVHALPVGSVGSGVYFVRLAIDDVPSARKLVVVGD